MQCVRYLLAAVVFALAANLCSAADANPKAESQVALQQLESWLGTGANGARWSNYLNLEVLHHELDRSDPADAAALSAVLAKLKGEAKGLERPRFQRLQRALADWVQDLSLPAPEALGDALKNAASQFHSISPGDLDQSRDDLGRDVVVLSAYLKTMGTIGPGWQKYLRLSDLQPQLKPGVAPDRELLANVAARFGADKPGLEIAQIRAVGDALTNYLQLLEAAASPDLEKQYETEVGGLAEWLGKNSQDPSEEAVAEINRRLAWLNRMHQAGNLVRAVRRTFDRPNLYVAAKTGIVGAGIERTLNDVAPLQDDINGTQISGTGRTVGQLKVELVPNPDHAVLDIMLTGTTFTNTVGLNGPATIYSQGTTRIGGRKRVVIDANGIRGLPSTAAAVTATRVTGVSAGRPGGLINGIAQQKVAEGKGPAEQVAARHAEARVRNRLDQEAARDLGRANVDFLEKFRNPLVRQRRFPSIFDLSTTQDLLHAIVLEADASQLGAAGVPPELDEMAYDLSLRLHESAANNLAAILLSGVTLHDEDVRKQIVEMRGSLPESLKDQEDQEPWSITFEKFRPVSLSLRDGGLEIVIRGQRYTTGENEAKKYGAMYVTAKYKTAAADKGYRLVRQGDLDINPPGQGRQSTATVALKAILRKKFAKLFPETIESEGLELPGKWKKAGKLRAAFVQIEGGWAAVGYRQAPVADSGAKVAAAHK